MSISEERRCNCGTYHLRNISFFAYWSQCKACGTYLCPQCSGLQNRRVTQFMFLAYMLVSYIFYFGIFLIIAPITGGTINILSSYLYAGILLFIPFIFLLLIIRSALSRIAKETKEFLFECPQCKGPMGIVYHDIFVYFWLFFIHVLCISTILNEIGIIFYNLSLDYVSVTIFFIIILAGIFILIIWIFKKIGTHFMTSYKMNTRVWLSELFSIFLYISINLIIIIFMSPLSKSIPISQIFQDALVSFYIFYSFISIIFWYFPAFLIGGFFYRLTQRYFLNINKSKIIQILIAISFIIIPFYLWGLMALYFRIYFVPSFYNQIHKILPFYSTLFNEIVPIISISFLIGTCITSLFRKLLTKSGKITYKTYLKPIILFGISLFTGFIFFENLFYLFSGQIFLDLLPNSVILAILSLVLIGILILLFYELLFNWASPQTRWGKRLEKYLGNLLYSILLGFIFVALSLAFPLIILLSSSSLNIIQPFSISIGIFSLKLMFIISFISGLVIGLKK